PQVAFRETIAQKAEYDYTHKKQTGGSGQFAKVIGYIEPLPPEADKTYIFENKVVGGRIPREFIPAVDKGFVEQLAKGTLIGYSTDLRSATQGKGEFTMEFSRYAPTPRGMQEELAKKYQEKRAAENK